MNYEQRYKEALERASKLRVQNPFDTVGQMVEHIFPDLQENEDERIRKELIDFVENWKIFNPDSALDDYAIYTSDSGECDKILAWLEKQGEQTQLDYEHANIPQKDFAPMELKFKVGDWSISNDKKSTYQVIEVKRGIYVIRDNADNHEYHIGIEECEKSGMLWNISDAKDGDVLYSLDSKQPFIYKERPQFSQARGHCCINKFGEFAIWNTSKCIICTDKYIPATKKQRDTLFAKMKEAGYEWNGEKKELKKIEL